jgi:hypothetical protein
MQGSGSSRNDSGGYTGGDQEPGDLCKKSRRGPINSPKAAVLAPLGVGSVLGVEVRRPGASPILTVTDGAGVAAGSLTFVGYLEIIDCIENRGFTYQATITNIAGGAYEVRVDPI